MPPVLEKPTYEERYKQELWAIEHFKQKAEFASETLPLAFAVGEKYKAARNLVEDYLGGMGKRAADVPSWLKEAYEKVGDVKNILDKVQAHKGLDELNIEALNNAAQIFNGIADQIIGGMPSKAKYEASMVALSEQEWSDYYQGQAFAHIHALDDMLQQARQTQVHYQITTEALENHAKIYIESEGAVEAVGYQKYAVVAEYAAQDDHVANRITIIEDELDNALDAVLKWKEDGNFQDYPSRPDSSDWAELEFILSKYPPLAEPHFQETQDIKNDYPLIFLNEDAASQALGSAIGDQLNIFELLMEGRTSGRLSDFLLEQIGGKDGFQQMLSPYFQEIFTRSGFDFEQLLKAAITTRFGFSLSVLEEAYATFNNLQGAFTEWWDELTVVETTGGTGNFGYSILGGGEGDTIVGNADANTIYGLGGSDTLSGNAGSDNLEGNTGNDTLHGGSETDYLYGGKGNDHLHGDAGNDFLYGDEGDDTYYYVNGDGHDQIYDVVGNDKLNINGQLISSITASDESETSFKDDFGNTYHLDDMGAMIITITNGGQTGTIRLDQFNEETNNFGLGVDGYVAPAPIVPTEDTIEINDNDIRSLGPDYAGQNGGIPNTYDYRESSGEAWLNQTSILLDGEGYFASVTNSLDGFYGGFEGGDKADVLNGSALANELWGGAGSDTIYGHEGNDLLQGGAGKDYLYGGEGQDNIWGSSRVHDDLLETPERYYETGITDTNYIEGNAGDDFISGGEFVDEIHGGTEGDYIHGGDGFDNIFGDEGNDVIFGDSVHRRDWIEGFDQFDSSTWVREYKIDFSSLSSAIGNDDIISGGEGHDIIMGEQGNDTVFGGAGDDSIWGDRSASIEEYNAGETVGDLEGLAYDTSSSFLAETEHGNDTLFGGAGRDDIYGNAGDDFIDGGTGNDTLVGGTGNDTLMGGSGIDEISGGTGNDTLVGGLGNDSMTGGVGDDTYILNLGDGHDTLQDEAGITTVTLNGISKDNVQFYRDDATGQVGIIYKANGDEWRAANTLWMDNDTFSRVATVGMTSTTEDSVDDEVGTHLKQEVSANAITGPVTLLDNDGQPLFTLKSGESLLMGLDGYNNELVGNADNNYLYVSEGSNILDGGLGEDTLDGGTGSDSLSGGEGADTLYGGGGFDSLSGGEGADFLYGGLGNDTLSGGAGAGDLLSGGAGSDTYLYQLEDESISIQNADNSEGRHDVLQFGEGVEPEDVVVKRVNLDLVFDISSTGGQVTIENYYADDGTNHRLDSIEFEDGTVWSQENFAALDLYGNSGSNNLTGTDEQDNIFGMAGNDKIWGYGADDVLNGGAGSDQIFGHDGNDILVAGESGSDTYRLGDGYDQLDGGNGSDVYLFSANEGGNVIANLDNSLNRQDVIRFDASVAFDSLDISRRTAQSERYNLYLHAGGTQVIIENYFLNDGNNNAIDAIEFEDGNVTLSQDDINAILMQGTGEQDSLHGTNQDDDISALAGWDSVYGYEGNDQILGGEGNDQIFGGAGNDTLYGDAGNDMLSGGEGVDTLYGGEGYDSLSGGAGNDKLYAGVGDDNLYGREGDDLLEGGSGENTYRFYADDRGTDTLVIDPSASDILRFEGQDYQEFTAREEGENLIIERKDELQTVIVTSWQASDFELTIGNVNISKNNILGLLSDNHGPAVDQGVSDENTLEDIAFSLSIPIDAFSDLDSDTLTYSAKEYGQNTLPAWLSFDGTSFSGTPSNDFVGAVQIQVTASDGKASVSTVFNLSVDNTNDRPEVSLALADQSANEGTALSFGIPDGSFTDVDADDSLSYMATLSDGSALPAWLSFDAETQTFNGTPAAADIGTMSIEVRASDLSGVSVSDVFDVTISNNLNHAPITQDDFAVTDEDASVTIDVLANDTDTDGDTLSVDTASAANGSVIINPDGTLRYTPDSGFSGSDSISYSISDSQGGTATSRVTVTVNAGDSDNAIIDFSGNDTLNGSNENDVLVTGDGDDVLSGLSGHDYLVGGAGSDTYVVGANSGHDIVVDTEGSNSIYFTDGIGFNDVASGLVKAGDDLVLTVGAGGDQVRIVNFFSLAHTAEKLEFESGGEISAAQLFAAFGLTAPISTALTGELILGDGGINELVGAATHDVLLSGDDNDTLSGLAGNDQLIGGNGNDIYIVGANGGQDTVIDTTGSNTIRFTEEVTFNDVASGLTKSGDDLVLNVGVGGDQVRIVNFFSLANTIDKFEFESGGEISANQLFDVFSVLAPTATAETIDVLSGVVGGDGKGGLSSSAANLNIEAVVDEPITLVGTKKADILLGGSSDDSLSGKGGADELFGYQGNDFLHGGGGADKLYGGSGADTLKGANGADQLYGGSGNDLLVGGKGNDTYHYQAGDGYDKINNASNNYATESDTLSFDSVDDVDDLWFTKKNNHLDIYILGSSDHIRVNNWYKADKFQLDSVEAGGQTIDAVSIEQLVNAMAVFGAPSGGSIDLTSDEQQQVNTAIAAAW